MNTVTRSRTVVVVGTRPRSAPADVLGDLRPGEEAALFLLGLDPTPGQRRFAEGALTMASEGRFFLHAELIAAPSRLREHLLHDDEVRVVARSREARRWRIEPRGLTAPGA